MGTIRRNELWPDGKRRLVVVTDDPVVAARFIAQLEAQAAEVDWVTNPRAQTTLGFQDAVRDGGDGNQFFIVGSEVIYKHATDRRNPPVLESATFFCRLDADR